jgi:spartin
MTSRRIRTPNPRRRTSTCTCTSHPSSTFPGIGHGGSQEDVDTFETIMAQCTAFLERAPPPKPPRKRQPKGAEDPVVPPYDPSAFKPGEGYVQGSASSARGQIVLVDEEDGSVVGELGEGFHVVEDSKMKAGSKGLCA